MAAAAQNMGPPHVSPQDTIDTGNALHVNWAVVPPATFQQGLKAELEHRDVTHGDLLMTGRIALAHLREDPYYYARHARMEAEADAYWKGRTKPSPTLGGGPTGRRVVLAMIAVIALLLIALFVWKRTRAHPGAQGRVRPGPVCGPGAPNRSRFEVCASHI